MVLFISLCIGSSNFSPTFEPEYGYIQISRDEMAQFTIVE